MFKNQARGTEDKRKKEFVNVRHSKENQETESLEANSYLGSSSFRFPPTLYGEFSQRAFGFHGLSGLQSKYVR